MEVQSVQSHLFYFGEKFSIIILAGGLLRSSKCIRMKVGCGFTPDLSGGAYDAPPDLYCNILAFRASIVSDSCFRFSNVGLAYSFSLVPLVPVTDVSFLFSFSDLGLLSLS